MAFNFGSHIVTNGLIFYVDAANANSYINGSTTWKDLTRNNNNGTLLNGPTFNSANAGSIQLTAGSGKYIRIPANTTIQRQFPFTIGVTALTVGTNNGYVFGTDDDISGYSGAGITMRANGTGSIRFGNSGPPTQASRRSYTFTSSLAVGQWVNVVFSCTSITNIKIYVNGIDTPYVPDNGTATTVVYNSGDPIVIGRNANNGSDVIEYYTGSISNVYMYDRALSATEALQNYNATKSRFNL